MCIVEFWVQLVYAPSLLASQIRIEIVSSYDKERVARILPERDKDEATGEERSGGPRHVRGRIKYKWYKMDGTVYERVGRMMLSDQSEYKITDPGSRYGPLHATRTCRYP